MIYIDEAAYAKTEVFFEVVLPILEREGVVAILVSTVQGDSNYFTHLVNKKFPGTDETIFNVLKMIMVCERCLDNGMASVCTHRRRYYPAWKNKKQQVISALLYQDRAQLERESLGIITEATNMIYVKEDIDYIHCCTKYNWEAEMNFRLTQGDNWKPPRFVFVSCDPNSNGANHCALMAAVYMDGKFIVSLPIGYVGLLFSMLALCYMFRVVGRRWFPRIPRGHTRVPEEDIPGI